MLYKVMPIKTTTHLCEVCDFDGGDNSDYVLLG
jgi:hypothetical protein